MKFYLLTAIFILFSGRILAQNTAQLVSVSGTVADSVTGQPVAFVTVSLNETVSKTIVKSLPGKADGSFKIEAASGNTYMLAISATGYKTATVPVHMINDAINLGTILLRPAVHQLKEVGIVAAKPLVKQQIDRLSYDVQADPDAKQLNVLEMLRKVPLLTVDAGDNIQLKGKDDFKILINGRSSALTAHNPADIFKAMPASSIQKIEVITTPPAKYDAEGLAGIINIITVKKISAGYSGNVNIRENTLYGVDGGASLIIKHDKLGVSLFTGTHGQRPLQTNTANTLQTFGTDATLLTQPALSVYSNRVAYGTAELSFEIDSLDLLTGSVDYNYGKFNTSFNQFSQLFDAGGSLVQKYNLINAGSSLRHALDIDINYQLGFKGNKIRLLTASYKYSRLPYTKHNSISIYNRFNFTQPGYIQQNNAGAIEQTYQVDYVHPLKKTTIEGGLKAILRSSSSDFETSDLDSLSQVYIIDPKSKNEFNYHQDVYSIYNTWEMNLDSWGIKGGVRIETTLVNADFVSVQSKVKHDYSNIIPSVSVQRKFKDGSSINFGFTNRIQRPDISRLNPFVDESNPKFISTGNPDLRPVLNHTFELNYNKYSKGSVNLGVNYAFATNTIQNVTRLLDSITYTTYQNLGSDKNLGFNISVSYPVTNKLNVSVNGQLSYIWLSGYFNGQLYSNRGLQQRTSAFAGYKLSKTWRAGVSSGIYSANVLLQGKSNMIIFSSFSTNKDVLKSKGNVSFAVNNPFSKYRNISNYTQGAGFYQTSMSHSFSRAFNIGFNYRFGKLKNEIKKNRTSINNDDIKRPPDPAGQ